MSKQIRSCAQTSDAPPRGRTPSFASRICDDNTLTTRRSPPTYLKRHVMLCVYTHSARGTPRLAVRPRSTLQPQAVTAPHGHQAVRLSAVRQMRSISEGAKPPSARGVSAFTAGVRINPFAHSIQEPMIKSTAGTGQWDRGGAGVPVPLYSKALVEVLGLGRRHVVAGAARRVARHVATLGRGPRVRVVAPVLDGLLRPLSGRGAAGAGQRLAPGPGREGSGPRGGKTGITAGAGGGLGRR